MGASTLTQLATASGPAGTLPASSRLRRISSFHFIGNCTPGVVCPIVQWFMCVLRSWGLLGLTSGSLAPSALAGASKGLPAASSPSLWGHCSPCVTLRWLRPGDAHQAFHLLLWPDFYLFIYASILDMEYPAMVPIPQLLPPLSCSTLRHCGSYL